MNPTDSLISIIKFLQELKLAKEEQNVQIERINLAISTLSEPLRQSIDYYLASGKDEKENSTLTNFQKVLKSSKEKIVKILKKSCIFRYFRAQDDLEVLKGCYDLVSDAIKMVQAEKDILELGLIKQELSKKQSQMNSLQAKVTDQKAQNFWKDFIGIDKMEAPVYELVNKLYQVEFEKLENKEQKDKIKRQYATQKLLKYLDLDGSGFVDIEEINKFFIEIWNNSANRENLINEILEEQDKPLLNQSQIMISILEECGLQQLITKFHSLNIDSKIFLQLDYNSLSQITSLESAVKINQAIQNHHKYIKDFKQIRKILQQAKPETQMLLLEYSKNPQEWKEGFTGICKVNIKNFGGYVIIQSVNGICRGTFIHLNENYRYVTWYGSILYFDPTKQKSPVQYYESFCYQPTKYLYNNNNIQEFQYNSGKQIFTLQQIDPFNISLSCKISLRKKKTGACITAEHGPSIKIDEKGNQVRLYYSYGEEVSYQQYIEQQDIKFTNRKYEITELEYAEDK